MEMKSFLSGGAALEPIMRVAVSKSGTSQVTNSHAPTKNVQKNIACANHTDIANQHEDKKEHCYTSGVNVSGNRIVRSRLLENGSVKTDLCENNRGDGDLQSLWPASSDMSRLACCCCIAIIACGIGLFPHGSRKQQTHVCTRQHISEQFWV